MGGNCGISLEQNSTQQWKKPTPTSCNYTEEHGCRNVEGKKPGTKEYVTCDFIRVKFQAGKTNLGGKKAEVLEGTDQDWEGHQKECSEVLEMFSILLWGVISWVFMGVKIHQAIDLRFVHFIILVIPRFLKMEK